eukprot:TRINITY_DN24989_c0_g1_i3.p1 TRINITY_DN24989_c0_g1~~TRINITY_DN24989_c0_g1_i3.p1  ORF type:complete len:591 (+),score=84.92 TRINITY_DN24989_c0_g1_i3:49-1773(+)
MSHLLSVWNWKAACVLSLFAVVGTYAKQPGNARKDDRPNIVFMLTDNLGFGDLGSYGGGALRGAPTPRLDKLASEGLRLTNFMVEPECTPSRSALMTGRMPIRSGTDSVAISPNLRDGLAPCEYTLAELLSDAGYATAHFGKWHLGSSQERLPNSQGFDEWFGIPRSSGESVWSVQPGFKASGRELEQVQQGVKGHNSSNLYAYDIDARRRMDANLTDIAVAYIANHSDGSKPFFIYLPFTLPHSPPVPHPDFDNDDRTQYQNVLVEIDYNTGRVLDALEANGISETTIVVWTSDNGPETMIGKGVDYGAQSDTGPFRGEFPSAWEGAIRTPCIVRWPGHVQAGRVSNEIMWIGDFYRSFASVAKASDLVPTNREIDSRNQFDFLFGGKEVSNRTGYMFFHSGELLALKWKNFKLHVNVVENSRGGVVQPGQAAVTATKTTPNVPWIFNIENDPKELWNLNFADQWITDAAGQQFFNYTESLKDFPNIKAGSNTCPWDVSTTTTLQPGGGSKKGSFLSPSSQYSAKSSASVPLSLTAKLRGKAGMQSLLSADTSEDEVNFMQTIPDSAEHHIEM